MDEASSDTDYDYEAALIAASSENQIQHEPIGSHRQQWQQRPLSGMTHQTESDFVKLMQSSDYQNGGLARGPYPPTASNGGDSSQYAPLYESHPKNKYPRD